MEVVYDLDTEAARTAARLRLPFVRAACPGVHPAFVAAVRELLVERAAVECGRDVERAALGALPAAWDVCAAGCCPNPRAARPALCQAEPHRESA
jgi:ferrochelatase